MTLYTSTDLGRSGNCRCYLRPIGTCQAVDVTDPLVEKLMQLQYDTYVTEALVTYVLDCFEGQYRFVDGNFRFTLLQVVFRSIHNENTIRQIPSTIMRNLKYYGNYNKLKNTSFFREVLTLTRAGHKRTNLLKDPKSPCTGLNASTSYEDGYTKDYVRSFIQYLARHKTFIMTKENAKGQVTHQSYDLKFMWYALKITEMNTSISWHTSQADKKYVASMSFDFIFSSLVKTNFLTPEDFYEKDF